MFDKKYKKVILTDLYRGIMNYKNLYNLLLFIFALASLTACIDEKGVTVERDILYGSADGEKLLLDIYRPEQQNAPGPAVVLIHGGGGKDGDKKDFRDLALYLAKSGYVSFSISYRLVKPQSNKYPAQLDDVQRAMRWIRANSQKYKIDPTLVAALGASAGGHLVSLLGMLETRDNSDPALAAYSSKANLVVNLFGPGDLTVPFPVIPELNVQELVNDFIGKPYNQAPDLYRDASPIFHIDRKTVPFLIFHGTADPLVPVAQSDKLAEVLRKAGVETTYVRFEGEGHGFSKKENGQKFLLTLMEFLNRHLKSK
jgi:acetyl esterase/lipase